jgi:hypothetical protein
VSSDVAHNTKVAQNFVVFSDNYIGFIFLHLETLKEACYNCRSKLG